MSSFLEMLANRQNDDPPARPDTHAQELELLARWRAYNERHEFTPGALVVEKPGLNVFRSGHGEYVLMFWRVLDPAHPMDVAIMEDTAKRLKINTLDCIVGVISA